MNKLFEPYDKLGPYSKAVRLSHSGSLIPPEMEAQIPGMAAGTVNRFEKGSSCASGTYKHYLEGLNLSAAEKDILRSIQAGCKQQARKKRESLLEKYHFSTIWAAARRLSADNPHESVSGYASGPSPRGVAELRNLVGLMAGSPYPAFIMDDLWYVHAFNASILELFGLRERHLWNPLIWNVLTTKFYEESPVGKAHITDWYFREATFRFFEETAEYFFTRQHMNLQRVLCQYIPSRLPEPLGRDDHVSQSAFTPR